jgi:hypothetical protein
MIVAAEGLVDQFVASCIGTLPDFAGIERSMNATDFQKVADKQWIRQSDGAVVQIEEASDRFVCMAGLTGEHVGEFSKQIKQSLADKKLGRYEEKQYEGRTPYLLQAQGGMTIIEVIPPLGATTFIVANAQKE